MRDEPDPPASRDDVYEAVTRALNEHVPDITLRDVFACFALLLCPGYRTEALAADKAYRQADAMMKRREQ